MNWRRGLMRTWMFASAVWVVGVFVLRFERLFWEVHVDDLFGSPWLPWWASLTSYVQPYADPALGTHPNPPGTVLLPSAALVRARIGDMLLLMVGPPAAVLAVGWGLHWVATGWKSTWPAR